MKLHPIDRSEKEIRLKSSRLLIQSATQNRILSHKLKGEVFSSLNVLEFISFQIAHRTAQTAQTQSALALLFHRALEQPSSKSERLFNGPIQMNFWLRPEYLLDYISLEKSVVVILSKSWYLKVVWTSSLFSVLQCFVLFLLFCSLFFFLFFL